MQIKVIELKWRKITWLQVKRLDIMKVSAPPLNEAVVNAVTWKYQQKFQQNLKINPKINRKTYSQDDQDDFLKEGRELSN